MIITPLVDLNLDYICRKNGHIEEKGSFELVRGDDVTLIRVLRDSHGTLDLVIDDYGEEVELYRIPKKWVTVHD